MLVVVTPATSTRLTTPTRARALLGLGSSVPPDEILERLIDQASASVAEYCKHAFGSETVEETFFCREPVVLSRDPVSAILSVTSAGSVVGPLGYLNDAGQIYRLDGSRRLSWWPADTVIRYTAGYALPTDEDPGTLPPPVERAATLLVGAYLSTRDRDPLIKSEDVDGVGSFTYWMQGAGSALPSLEAASLLAPYRSAAWSVG